MSGEGRYILTLPLKTELYQEHILEKRFRLGEHLYNNFLSFEKKKFYEMTKRKDYRDAQSLIKDLTIQINELDKQSDKSKEAKQLIQELRKQRKEQYDIIYNIKKMFDWSEFGFTNDMKKYRKYYKANLNSTICDNLSGRCFKAFEKMESELIKDQYRNDEDKVNPCVHYKRKDSLRCLTAKKNSTGIRFSLDEGNKIGTVKWQGLVFSIDLSKCTLYEWQALQSDICYCAVKREKIKGKWKYYIQITLKGHVPDKFDKQTGELKRQLGKGNVGLYFTSTSLTVSTENGVKTYPLEIKNHEDKKTELLQEILANEVIASGDVFNCNKMDFKFLQKNLGKKIQSASPAMLKTTIERKLSYHGVSINEISYSKLNPIFVEKNVSKKDLEEVAALIRQF